MRQRRPYNPNTKYGRKKLRQQIAYKYQHDPAYRKDYDNISGCVWLVVFVIIIAVFVLIYVTKGEHAAIKWLR